MDLWAVCHTCQHKHSLHEEAQGAFGYWQDWLAKHPDHEVALLNSPRKQHAWRGYKHNADVKEAYASHADYTITLASLASDTTLLAGRESTAVSNTTNKYKDYLIGGKVTTGTSPTASRLIEVWLYGSVDDTPTYPDVLDGTDSAETITTDDIKQAALYPLKVMSTDATSNRTYWFGPIGIAQVFGGRIPKNHGLFVTHSTAVNLHATGSNHDISYTGHYDTVV